MTATRRARLGCLASLAAHLGRVFRLTLAVDVITVATAIAIILAPVDNRAFDEGAYRSSGNGTYRSAAERVSDCGAGYCADGSACCRTVSGPFAGV
jgi:hypothetical protein